MSSSQPLVSVVIPCYNSERWVVAAIDSVLNQAHPDVEVVAVNDGSTDGTLLQLLGFENRIRIVDKLNGGVISARLAGVAAARGNYIKFLDSDDLVPSNTFEFLATASSEYPGSAFIGRSIEISESGSVLGDQMYAIGCSPTHLSEFAKEYLLTQATPSGLWLIPRSLFSDHDLFGSQGIQMGEEYAFCMGIIRSRVSVRFIDRVVCAVRVHDAPTRLSRSTDESRHLTQAELIRDAIGFIRSELPDHDVEAINRLSALCWTRGRDCLRMGNANAAKRYFELASLANSSIRPVGSHAYRAMCRVFGPSRAERILESMKSFRNIRRTTS